jgi:hypothetical protein
MHEPAKGTFIRIPGKIYIYIYFQKEERKRMLSPQTKQTLGVQFSNELSCAPSSSTKIRFA